MKHSTQPAAPQTDALTRTAKPGESCTNIVDANDGAGVICGSRDDVRPSLVFTRDGLGATPMVVCESCESYLHEDGHLVARIEARAWSRAVAMSGIRDRFRQQAEQWPTGF